MKRALILGITGQDGSYLADILLENGYDVHGFYRRSSVDNLYRIRHILNRVKLHQGDLLDSGSLLKAIRDSDPCEIYNEADQDHIGWSYAAPHYSMSVTAGAVATLLETVRQTNKDIRIFQPVSSTIFGNAPPPQTEETRLDPQSPYACAKAAAFYLARYYRQAYDMPIYTGIMYNHDSPRRGGNYLLQEIARSALKVADGNQEKILVGDPDMVVDIGYAKEFMEYAHRIVQCPVPDDYIISTGVGISVRTIAQAALKWVGICPCGRIDVDLSFNRPDKFPTLVGDPSKLFKSLGSAPADDALSVVQDIISYLPTSTGK